MRDGPVGLAIEAVLPFAAETFVEDFADDDSRAEFHALLGRARAVLELPGTREAAVAAYEMAALTVLNQCDIIIAVWDGGPSHGHGGTTETIDVAARMGLPIIFVDANGAERPRLHWTGLDDEAAPGERFADLPAEPLAKGLPRLVDALLRPPSGSAAGPGRRLHHEDEGEGLSRYFDETAPATNLAVGFPMLLAVFGVRRLSGTDLRPRKPALLAAELAAIAPQDGDAQDRTTSARPVLLADAYGWADFVGAQLAQIFRGAFILNFVFGALAVAAAAVSIIQHEWKLWLVCVELALIVVVVVNTLMGLRRQWHRRWFEGRELAERLRVATLLWMVGLRPDAANGIEPTWTGWYARAMTRAQGLRHARLDQAGVAAAEAAAIALLDDQCTYHHVAAARMHTLEHRLERAGGACLALTILVALTYLAVFAVVRLSGEHEVSLEFALAVAALSASLPALATATYGIRVIGDFAGISRRSERTHHGLAVLVARLKANGASLPQLRARVRAAAGVMLGDVAGWRLSAESRGLAIPG